MAILENNLSEFAKLLISWAMEPLQEEVIQTQNRFCKFSTLSENYKQRKDIYGKCIKCRIDNKGDCSRYI